MKIPYEEIKRRVLEMDEANLSIGLIEQLIKYLPEPEQLNQLAAMKEDWANLSEPEQFSVLVSRGFGTRISMLHHHHIHLF